VHNFDHEARIHHGNRRTPPPGVPLAASCGRCDVRGGAGAITVASMVSRPAGRTFAELERPALRGTACRRICGLAAGWRRV
jgi:hypothetical protein